MSDQHTTFVSQGKEHVCIMEDKLEKAIEGIRTQNRWFMGIFGGAIILLLVGYGSMTTAQVNDRKQVNKINSDYTPIFAFQYIVESNNKMANLILAIDAKDDHRYQQALKEWNELQQEVVKQAGLNKRGGSLSSAEGGK